MAGLERGARLSADGVYRYELTRTWSEGTTLRWVMLNPSTADADVDDPTIRRCIGFSKLWNYGGLVVHNLYALRATDPRELADHPDPVGPDNDEVLAAGAGRHGDIVVCAWGAHPAARTRALEVVALLRGSGSLLGSLGLTKAGAPRHPLYVAGDTVLRRWVP